jgi:hypothetical protein
MADLTSISGAGALLNTGASTAYTIFKVVGVLLLVGIIFYYLYQRKQYKYSIKLKILQNEQFVYYENVAKLKRVDGAPFWFIKGLKELVTIPPAESMYLSTNGRWVAEGYYDRTAGVIWSKDTLSKTEFAKLAMQISKQRTGKESGTSSVDTHYQPMTSTERSLQANQVTKALLRKGKDVWAMIWQLVPVVVLLVLFVLVLIFWNDIAKPVIALEASTAKISEDNGIMQQQNIRLYQMLTGGKGNGTSYVVQELPSDKQYFLPERPTVNTT